MPYLKVQNSWRINPEWDWCSWIPCFFGKHFFFYSSVTNKPIICVVCKKKTKHYDQG